MFCAWCPGVARSPTAAPPPPAAPPTGHKRLHSGSKIKTLTAVLGLGGQRPPPGPGGRTASHMPLAVIVDDRVEVRVSGVLLVLLMLWGCLCRWLWVCTAGWRCNVLPLLHSLPVPVQPSACACGACIALHTHQRAAAPRLPQVWDDSSRSQVLQVEPFRPWEEQAAQDCGLSGTPTMQARGVAALAAVCWPRLQSCAAGCACAAGMRIPGNARPPPALRPHCWPRLEQPSSMHSTLLPLPTLYTTVLPLPPPPLPRAEPDGPDGAAQGRAV